jgi:hypothetical protein
MHIQGHSSAGGTHRAGGQQNRVRDAAEKQQGRHILPINANPEVQAEFRAMTELEASDQLTARHRFAV